MALPKTNYHDIAPEEVSFYKKGLSMQREYYKEANLNNDYDVMVKCIENLKSELKDKAINKGNTDLIKRIEDIVEWYKRLPQKYTKLTENGYATLFPNDLHIRISKNLNIAYELIIKIMIILDLL